MTFKSGLIIGGGLLPFEILAKYKKDEIFIIALKEAEINLDLLKEYHFEIISFVKVGKIMKVLKQRNIKEVCFAGNVKKPSFTAIKPDFTGFLLLLKLLKLKNKGDNNILKTIIEFINSRGFIVKSATETAPEIIMKKGVLTKTSPSKMEEESIKIGFDLLKAISIFDVGQACVVQENLIIGIEGFEGTDGLLKRCSEIKHKSKNPPILVKSAKEGQNLKIDMPTIGLKTIINLHQYGYKGIAVKAETSIFLEQKEAIDFANKNDIFIIGI